MSGFVLLGLALLLAAQLLAASAVSTLVALCFPALEALLCRLRAPARAGAALALALLPSAAGLTVAIGMVLPALIAREPWRTGERVPLPLAVLAVAGAALLIRRVGSGLRLLRRSSRLAGGWMREGAALAGLALPATRFDHELPVAALVGLARPHLLLAERLLAALERDELAAVVAHELGHLTARDNLKRVLLAASPDLLALTPLGARMRRSFESAAEAAADLYACARVPPVRLASALVKAAALVPAGRRLELPLAALDGDGSLAVRVRTLLAAEPSPHGAPGRLLVRGLVAAVTLAGVVGLVVAASLQPWTHGLIETVVRRLS